MKIERGGSAIDLRIPIHYFVTCERRINNVYYNSIIMKIGLRKRTVYRNLRRRRQKNIRIFSFSFFFYNTYFLVF